MPERDLGGDVVEVDGLRVDVESTLVEPREVEEVEDEALEPRGFGVDHARGGRRREHAVVQRFGVARELP